MDIMHAHWSRRRTRTAYSLLSIALMLSMVVGGILSPWLVPPAHGQAAPQSQQPEAIDIGKSEQSEFSPHMKASYGELITYTLVFTMGSGLHSNIIITDTFGNPSGGIWLPVTPTNSFGPYPISGAGIIDPPDATMQIYWPPSMPGRPVVHWVVGDIDNTSGGDWVFGLRYRALVHTDNQIGNPTRRIASTAKVKWDQGAPVTDTTMEVWLAQPQNFSFAKDQLPPEGTPLNPGATVTWTISLRDHTGDYQGSAYDILVTDTLPSGVITDVISAPAPTATYSVQGNKVIFSIPELPPTTYNTNLRIRAHLPTTGNVAHGKVYNVADLFRSSAPGTPVGERTWLSQDSTTAYIRNINLTKAQSSDVYYNNSDHQAVAGEEVLVTVNIVVPQGLVIYDPRVRILLKDGMTLTEVLPGTPPYDLATVNPADQDPDRPAGAYWTQYQWTKMDSISDTGSSPVTLTMSFRAQVRQRYFLQANPSKGQEIPHGTFLDIVPIVRWADQPGGVVADTACSTSLCQRNVDSNPTVSVQFIRPDLRYASTTSGSYFSSSGAFQGNGAIAFTLHLRNRSGSPSYPTAYPEAAESLIEVLSPDLTYQSATPPPDDVLVGASGTTVTWDVTGIITNNTRLYVVNASLPPTMVVGLVVTATAHARYSTFAGSTVPDEGIYFDAPPATNPAYTAQTAILGGFYVTKTVTPTDNVRIGDTVTYTVRLELNQGMVMYVPSFTDILPKGFHYVDGSMVTDPPDMLTGTVSYTGTGVPTYQQKLSWKLETMDNQGGSGTQVVLVQYHAVMTGLDWRYGANGQPVWASSRSDMVNKQNADNAVTTCWQEAAGPGQPTHCLATTVRARTRVVQPYLADTPPWNKVRTEAVNKYEVGDQVNFKVTLKNAGQGTAYDVVLKDMLPRGIAYADSWVEPSWIVMTPPPYTSTGEITWILEAIPVGQQVDVVYRTTVMNTAIPGDYLTNLASIYDYTSMPGAADPERHYRDFDGAFSGDPIPVPDPCTPFVVLGVGLSKTDLPDPVEPGAVLTYTLTFSNSSGRYGAVDARITDTYDANLTYLGASVSHPSLIQGPYSGGLRTLYWTIAFLPNNNPTEYWIKPYFQVAKPFDPLQVPLENTAGIDGASDRTGAVWRTEETGLKMPALQIKKYGTPAFVPAGGTIAYTLRFTNTAAYPVTATGVVVEDTYDPNVSFVSASPAPINPPDNDRWSVDPLGQNDWGSIKVTVTVDMPVPAGVTQVVNRASISCDQVLASASPPFYTALQVPVLNISTIDYPDPVSPTWSLAYTIAFTNNGTANATNPILVDTLDPNVTFFDAVPDPVGNTCPGNVCTWNLPNLNQGSFSKVTLYVNVKPEIPPGVVRLVNRAALSSDQVGPNTDIEYTAIWGAGGAFPVYLPLIYKNATGEIVQ